MVNAGTPCGSLNFIYFKKRKWGKKFSMAIKYKFNISVLPYAELHRAVTLEKVSLHLCPLPTLSSCHLLLATSEKIPGFYQLLDYPSTAVFLLWYFCYVSCNEKELTSR